MNLEYILREFDSGGGVQLNCAKDSEAIIRNVGMNRFNDCIEFKKKKRDGSTYGSFWGLEGIGHFVELESYNRLMDMPEGAITKLASRIYELLFMASGRNKNRHRVEPKVDEAEPKYQQILKELRALQETQRELFSSGELVFPEISDAEFRFYDFITSN